MFSQSEISALLIILFSIEIAVFGVGYQVSKLVDCLREMSGATQKEPQK